MTIITALKLSMHGHYAILQTTTALAPTMPIPIPPIETPSTCHAQTSVLQVLRTGISRIGLLSTFLVRKVPIRSTALTAMARTVAHARATQATPPQPSVVRTYSGMPLRVLMEHIRITLAHSFHPTRFPPRQTSQTLSALPRAKQIIVPRLTPPGTWRRSLS